MSMPEVDRVAAAHAPLAARRARAAVKQDLISGARTALEVLDASTTVPPGAPEATLRARELLACLRMMGPKRVAAVMGQLGIADSKRLAGLGVRQRAALRRYLIDREVSAGAGRLVVLAGPTAVGKGTVSTYIREHYPAVALSVSATTRAPRPGEVDGVSYFFVSDDEFDRMIRNDEFLEYATVHNAWRYGTPRAPVEQALAAGRSVLLEIDIQGARQVRRREPSARLVFLQPPSWEELVRRLIGRGTESTEEQARRLESAKVEMAAQGEFDHSVVNRDVATAAQEVVELMEISQKRSTT
jgi:guanylate kinase